MPLNAKGKKIMTAMKKQYGEEKGERVFYASKNKGTIKGVEKGGTAGNTEYMDGQMIPGTNTSQVVETLVKIGNKLPKGY